MSTMNIKSQTPLINSVSSTASISNFVAQTPKDNHFKFNFKKSTQNKVPLIQQRDKENNFLQANRIKQLLPYKMIKSEFPSACQNHNEKQSAFYVESNDGQTAFYCEKCAILIASQGFNVKKIENYFRYEDNIVERDENIEKNGESMMNNTKTVVKKSKSINEALKREAKQNQLTSFLNRLERIQSRIDKNYQTNINQLQEIDSCTKTQVREVKQFFGKLHSILDQFQYQYIEQLNCKNHNARLAFEIECQQIQQDMYSLQSMKSDICSSYDDIISVTTNQQFQTVITGYTQNLDEIKAHTQKPNELIITNKKDLCIDIKINDIQGQIQKQYDRKLQPLKRLSNRSTRRMSLGIKPK